ncbi:MAG: carbamoyltransferase C-terminal domain-containing protein [Syntrophales bacterium]
MNRGVVLGIWDGHDAGAALVSGEEVLCAVNEERLTRRKLEVGFPRRAIETCLAVAGLAPGEVETVAASTTDPAKTLTRFFPGLKEEYYLIRRRKMAPRRADPFKKAFKYRFTELPPNVISRLLSGRWLKRRLAEMGFTGFQLEIVDHHAAHASAAAACSGFPAALVLTLDGVGDGLSGSLWRWANGALEPLKSLPARTSLGIFFEHVTNLMNMRELEDEGKVMALANFAYPIPDAENPLMGIIGTRGLDIVSAYSSTEMFRELKRILWRYPSEQFAFMAQRVLEKNAVALAGAALEATGLARMAVAGGVFSNVKMNMQLMTLPRLERLYVFPHMGDGGLALGAALVANRTRHGVTACGLAHLYLGPGYSSEDVLKAIGVESPSPHPSPQGGEGEEKGSPAAGDDKNPASMSLPSTGGDKDSASSSPLLGRGHLTHVSPPLGGGHLTYVSPPLAGGDKGEGGTPGPALQGESASPSGSGAVNGEAGDEHKDWVIRRLDDPAAEAARLIVAGEIVLWFQGRMEFGPRALGHRSILARPDDRTIKDRLNILLKKRVWYQPFCPSMLIEDAALLLETDGQEIRDNRFMTMGFKVRPERLALMEGVINVDGTCRPQFVGDEEPRYRGLLLGVREALGFGVVLNTSFNLHGEPLVCAPGEAIEMLRRTGIRYLFMEDVLVENTRTDVC